MIIKVLDNIVYADDKPVAKNLRMNFASGGKFRLMADYYKDGEYRPIDFVIHQISFKMVKITEIGIFVNCIERVRKTSVDAIISFDLLKKQLSINGKANGIKFSKKISSIPELLVLLQNLA